jgi:hypothetical protein
MVMLLLAYKIKIYSIKKMMRYRLTDSDIGNLQAEDLYNYHVEQRKNFFTKIRYLVRSTERQQLFVAGNNHLCNAAINCSCYRFP